MCSVCGCRSMELRIAATRSAIRTFQRREGLPVDGVVGPDTERALIAARGGLPRDGAPPRPEPFQQADASQAAGAPGPSEPAAPSAAAEFDVEWDDLSKNSTTRETLLNARRSLVASRRENAIRTRLPI